MKFIIQGPLKDNINNLTRKVGYIFQGEQKNENELNLIRPLAGRSGYPRFHLYIKTEGLNFVFNLHLDQKKPIYKGASAHAGEYDGDLVEREAERIKEILKNL